MNELSKDRLIPQEGEIVCERERLKSVKLFITPKGECVLDFGQNMAGYIEFTVDAKKVTRYYYRVPKCLTVTVIFILKTFKKHFNVFKTQTECVLALYFNLTDQKAETAKQLADMVRANGNKLQTGFVGTPYILYALSENGYTDTEYDLLFQNEYPLWLYEVEYGASTIWEHWDGIKADGSFWSKDMNSYNHYAYGSVMDWVYTVAGGINPVEDFAGFEKVLIAPKPNRKMNWLKVSLDTAYGRVISKWCFTDIGVRYEITTPVKSEIVIGDKTYNVEKGRYVFYSDNGI